jgi:hypothetical protein
MEYKLNKIDPELRERVNEITKEGKVHSKQNIIISKDKKEKNKKNNRDFKSELIQYDAKGKKLTVNAYKTQSSDVEAFRDEDEKDTSKGIFLDVRK